MKFINKPYEPEKCFNFAIIKNVNDRKLTDNVQFCYNISILCAGSLSYWHKGQRPHFQERIRPYLLSFRVLFFKIHVFARP